MNEELKEHTSEWRCVFDPEYIKDGCPYGMRMITTDPESGMFFSKDNIYDLIAALIAMLKEGERHEF